MIDGKLHIDGFPDAAKAIAIAQLVPRLPEQLAALALHMVDLNFSQECLTLLKTMPDLPETAREALWRSAIMFYCRCFDDSRNSRKYPLRVRKYAPEPDRRSWHRHFLDLRHMHLAHDDNALLQAYPLAVVAKPGKQYSIERVLCMTIQSGIKEPERQARLSALIEMARTWVESESTKLHLQIADELEKVDYQTLIDQPAAGYRAPTIEDVSKSRPPVAGPVGATVRVVSQPGPPSS